MGRGGPDPLHYKETCMLFLSITSNYHNYKFIIFLPCCYNNMNIFFASFRHKTQCSTPTDYFRFNPFTVMLSYEKFKGCPNLSPLPVDHRCYIFVFIILLITGVTITFKMGATRREKLGLLDVLRGERRSISTYVREYGNFNSRLM